MKNCNIKSGDIPLSFDYVLAKNLKEVFTELDDESLKILNVLAQEGPSTVYEVWRKIRKDIPLRTVYNKFSWLRAENRRFIYEVKQETFKKRLVKVYYDVTLKGMLAALAAEISYGNRPILDRLRERLHIPEKFKKAVRPIVLIWAHFEARTPKTMRGEIELFSIFMSVMQTIAACKGIGTFSTLRKTLNVSSIDELKKGLNISDEEFSSLENLLSYATLKVMQSLELQKRTLAYATSTAPLPWLSDCVEVSADLAVRLLWYIPGDEYHQGAGFHAWLSWHKGIADIISRGDLEELGRFIENDLLPRLKPKWELICFRKQLDGTCSQRNIQCPYTNPIHCDLARKKAKGMKTLLKVILGTI